MKRSELSKGMMVAMVAGEGADDKRPNHARKVEVLEFGLRRQYSSQSDGVRVREVDDPLNQAPRAYGGGGKRNEDGTLTVGTKRLWMPWEDALPYIEAHAEKVAAHKAKIRAQQERVEAVRKALADRGFRAEGDIHISWPNHTSTLMLLPIEAVEFALGINQPPAFGDEV